MILPKSAAAEVRRLILLPGMVVSLLVMDMAAQEEPAADQPPDFTTNGQRGESHDWLLGPTGMRGWMYFRHEDLTAASRQILVTAVEKGSPADGIVKDGDVIIGVFGKPFESDARRSFGQAIGAAEEKTGILPLMVWRDGNTLNVELKLKVLGAYSATAPYDCPKSRNIFEQGCRLIAEKGFENADIPDHLNALALLASGDKKHHSVLREYAEKAAQSVQPEDTWNWYIAYVNLFLSEFTLATGKKTVFSELKKTTMRGVKNQCRNGMWGHAPALPNGHSEGYGGMNVIGLPMTISLVLAREAGVKDPDLDKAIDKSTEFLRYYVDKGAIPYGDHPPGANVHDDNGKASCAAVLFDLRKDRDATEFFSRMATAAYDQREQGHCGNFWNMLWALPGVSRSGPHATGAYLREQAWYYDLARNWKGGFVYQKIEEGEENDNYTNWDLTGGYLLSFGLYHKSLHILGKNPSAAPALDAQVVKNVIAAGRDRYPEGARNGYHKRHDEILLEGLASWSPVVRYHSAQVMGVRGGNFTPSLLEMLGGKNRYARYGAVEALGRLGKHAEAALPRLRATLQAPDPWLQCLAAEALARMGDKSSAGDLMGMSLRTSQSDPRRMHQRAASRALFSPYPGNSEPVSLLSGPLDGVDRDQLYLVMKSFLENEDSVVRASVIPALRKLNDRDLAPLLPTLASAVETLAPTNEMWGDDIRQAGLDILSSHHIREGMLLCVSTIEWRWGLQVQPRMDYLARYGKHAREVIPALKKLVRDLEKKEVGGEPSENRKLLIKAIDDIEASKEEPRMVTMKEFMARATEKEKRDAKGTADAKARGKPLKVFLLAGQSNMQGHAEIRTFDAIGDDPATAPMLKKMRGTDGKPHVCDKVWISSVGCAGDGYADVIEQTGKLTAGFGAGEDKIGPEFTFGMTMEARLKEPVLLIKTAWGGRSLMTDFRPPSAGKRIFSEATLAGWKEQGKDPAKQAEEENAKCGIFYGHMIAHIRKVLEDIPRVVPGYDTQHGYELAGFVWFQGFNDYVDSWGYPDQDKPGGYDEYSRLLAHLIRDVRKDLSAPKMPFVIGVMGIDGKAGDTKPPMMHFRQAQLAPTLLPEFKGNVAAVATAPFWVEELAAIDKKRERVELEAHLLRSKDPNLPNKDGTMSEEAQRKHLEEFEARLISPAEAALWKRGSSNAGYHYLGSAKTFAQIGKAFAEANLKLLPGAAGVKP